MLRLAARLLAALTLGALAAGAPAAAQPDLPPALVPLPPDTTARLYASSAALTFQITEFGLGAGGASRIALTDDLSFLAEVSVGAGRDEREQQFFVGFFGDSVVPFKRNYVLLVPFHLGVERRLFREAIEDNFRPFVQATAGPTLALQWPYFDDLDGDGQRSEGEDRLGGLDGFSDARPRLGVGGTVALGAAFGRSRRTATSIRLGFTGQYFPAEVDLLELRSEVESPSRSTFWTPVISVHIGRL